MHEVWIQTLDFSITSINLWEIYYHLSPQVIWYFFCFLFFVFLKENNWWQVMVIQTFQIRRGYEEFHPASDHSQTNSPAQSIKPKTFHLLFIY